MILLSFINVASPPLKSGKLNPVRILISVVLPEPLFPSRHIISPYLISREKSLIIAVPLIVLLIPQVRAVRLTIKFIQSI